MVDKIENQYELWIERFGDPILKIDVFDEQKEMTFEQELADMPYKIAVFNNPKNQIGMTVCAKYADWHMNCGEKWLIKYLFEENRRLKGETNE